MQGHQGVISHVGHSLAFAHKTKERVSETKKDYHVYPAYHVKSHLITKLNMLLRMFKRTVC